METLKSEFQSDIIDFANSPAFKDTLTVLVQNWIGSKITDASNTLESFVDDTLKREFKFEDSFWSQLEKTWKEPWNQTIPQVVVAKGTKDGKEWYSYDKDYKIKQFLISKRFNGYHEPISVGTFKAKEFSLVKFENEEPIINVNMKSNDSNKYGDLFIKVLGVSNNYKNIHNVNILNVNSTMKRKHKEIGTCSISLLEAYNKHGSANKWPIFHGSERVGFIKLIITFDKENVTTLRERIGKLITNKTLDEIAKLQENIIGNSLMEEMLSSFPSDHENLKPFTFVSEDIRVEHFVEIGCKDKLVGKTKVDLFYNNKMIGNLSSLVENGPFRCPNIMSITNDIIEMKPSDGTEIPLNSQIQVSSIPWKHGLDKQLRDINLHLELRSKAVSGKPTNRIEIALIKKLLHVLYFYELSQITSKFSSCEIIDGVDCSSWNGSLRSNVNFILTILRPYCSSKEWNAITIWTILGVRTFFPKIKSKIINGHLKYLMKSDEFDYSNNLFRYGITSNNDYVIENYEIFCCESIANCHEFDLQEVVFMQELQYTSQNLFILDCCNVSGVTRVLIPLIREQVRKSVPVLIKEYPETSKPLELCKYILEEYKSRLELIHDKFGEFAEEIWCPILALNVIEESLPKAAKIVDGNIETMDLKDDWVMAKNADSLKEDLTSYISIYRDIKNFFKYRKCSKCPEIESMFIKHFENCLSKLLALMKEKGKIQIISAVHEQKVNVGINRNIEIKSYQDMNEFDFLDEIAWAKDIIQILEGFTGPWREILNPFSDSPDMCRQLLNCLHDLLMFYIEKFKKIVLSNTEFFLPDYSRIVMSLFHVKCKFVENFCINDMNMNTNENIDQNNKNRMEEEFVQQVTSITNWFASCQKNYLESYLDRSNKLDNSTMIYAALNKQNSMSGHMKGLLEYLYDKQEMYLKMSKNEEAANRIMETFEVCKRNVFKLEEEAIVQHFETREKRRKSSFNPINGNKESLTSFVNISSITSTLRKSTLSVATLNLPLGTSKSILTDKEFFDVVNMSRILRKEEQVEVVKTLNDIYDIMLLKSATPLQLISRYLELTRETCLRRVEDLGTIKFIIGRVGFSIYVYLKSVDLIPKEEEEDFSFKIKVMLFPVKRHERNRLKGYISKSTPVYQNKTTVIFNMEANQGDASDYKFEFDLGEEVEHREDGPCVQYLEISSYAISATKIWKYFRGHILIPITSHVPIFDRVEDFDEHCAFSDQGAVGKFVSPNDIRSINAGESSAKSKLLCNLENELRARSDGKQFVKHRESQFLNCKTKNKLKK